MLPTWLLPLTLCAQLYLPMEQESTLTWYGEEYLGRRHAASWHGQTPEGMPEVVTREGYGIAAPYDIPFGTAVRVTRLSHCNGEASEYDGLSVNAIVIDRLSQDWAKRWDAWPVVFEALGEFDEGCLKVRIDRIENVEGGQDASSHR